MSSAEGGMSMRVAVAVAMVGLTGAWNAGNVGPVASEVAAEFDISLGLVGVLAGTLFLGSSVVGLLFAAQVGERLGQVNGLRLACGLLVGGNLIFALAPDFALLTVGRILPGFGFALVNVIGAVWARNEGGVKLLGVFGASIQLGIAAALLVGSALSDQGVDWRVGFAISAALGIAALFSIPAGSGSGPVEHHRLSDFFRIAMRHARVYRLALLFVSIYGVPMILSAWVIEYLARDGDVRKALAGVVAFLLFGLSAVVRVIGARMKEKGVSHMVLSGTLGLAAIGCGAIALDPVMATAFAGVVLLGVGFGIPYATALTEAQQLYPEAPGEPVALMTLVALVPPIAVIPVVGHLISNDRGDLAFGSMALFLVLATLLNLRRTGIPLTGDDVRCSRQP